MPTTVDPRLVCLCSFLPKETNFAELSWILGHLDDAKLQLDPVDGTDHSDFQNLGIIY